MPYLFQAAVCAHETGIPIMRPMLLEFPEDPASDMLDRQYMLGENILVAPVFREDGWVDYYLPSGRWTHLLDGTVHEGGRWYQRQYDYFSLPIFVRENTLLPWGKEESRTVYPYAQQVQLHAYFPQEECSCRIPDETGREALYARLEETAEGFCLQLDREAEGLILVLHTDQEILDIEGGQLRPEGDTTVAVPCQKTMYLRIKKSRD